MTLTVTMKRKVAITGVGLLGITGVGLGSGAAFAQSAPSTVPPPAATSAPAPNTAASAEAPEAPEAAGTAAETPGAEGAGEANLPGGGHADAAGQNVDHQFQGVE